MKKVTSDTSAGIHRKSQRDLSKKNDFGGLSTSQKIT